jgi:ATPase
MAHLPLIFNEWSNIMEIKREKYLNDLINRMHNGLIKVITGVRRSGKSYLLFMNIPLTLYVRTCGHLFLDSIIIFIAPTFCSQARAFNGDDVFTV